MSLLWAGHSYCSSTEYHLTLPSCICLSVLHNHQLQKILLQQKKKSEQYSLYWFIPLGWSRFRIWSLWSWYIKWAHGQQWILSQGRLIYWFLWHAMIQGILDHWSQFESSQWNTPCIFNAALEKGIVTLKQTLLLQGLKYFFSPQAKLCEYGFILQLLK